MNCKKLSNLFLLFLVLSNVTMFQAKAHPWIQKYHKPSVIGAVTVAGCCMAYTWYQHHHFAQGCHIVGVPFDVTMQLSAAYKQGLGLGAEQAFGCTIRQVPCLRQQGATCGYHAAFNAGCWAKLGKLLDGQSRFFDGQKIFNSLYNKRGSLPEGNLGIGHLVKLRNEHCPAVQIFGKAPDGRWIFETKASGALSALQSKKIPFSAVVHVHGGHWIAVRFVYEKDQPVVLVADSNGGDYANNRDIKKLSRIVFKVNHGHKIVVNKGNFVPIGNGDVQLRA